MRWGLLLGLVALVGCGDEVPAPEGIFSFRYRLVEGNVALLGCTNSAGVTVASVRLLVGDDNENANGQLDSDEIQDTAESACNQLDANGDGSVNAAEFGDFSESVIASGYELIAVELIDDAGDLIPWLAPGEVELATRNSFGQGGLITVPVDAEVSVAFDSGAGELSIEF